MPRFLTSLTLAFLFLVPCATNPASAQWDVYRGVDPMTDVENVSVAAWTQSSGREFRAIFLCSSNGNLVLSLGSDYLMFDNPAHLEIRGGSGTPFDAFSSPTALGPSRILVEGGPILPLVDALIQGPETRIRVLDRVGAVYLLTLPVLDRGLLQEMPCSQGILANVGLPHGQMLVVMSQSPVGELFLNGEPIGRAPGVFQVLVHPGEHTLELRASGYRTWTQAVSPDGSDAEIRVYTPNLSRGR